MPMIDSSSATAASADTRIDSDRGRASDRSTSASKVATDENGRFGSRLRTTCRSAGTTGDGFALVRAITNRAWLVGDSAWYTVPSSGLSSPRYFTSLTTPTTVVRGQVLQPP